MAKGHGSKIVPAGFYPFKVAKSQNFFTTRYARRMGHPAYIIPAVRGSSAKRSLQFQLRVPECRGPLVRIRGIGIPRYAVQSQSVACNSNYEFPEVEIFARSERKMRSGVEWVGRVQGKKI